MGRAGPSHLCRCMAAVYRGAAVVMIGGVKPAAWQISSFYPFRGFSRRACWRDCAADSAPPKRKASAALPHVDSLRAFFQRSSLGSMVQSATQGGSRRTIYALCRPDRAGAGRPTACSASRTPGFTYCLGLVLCMVSLHTPGRDVLLGVMLFALGASMLVQARGERERHCAQRLRRCAVSGRSGC